jgi:hypothetical protein
MLTFKAPWRLPLCIAFGMLAFERSSLGDITFSPNNILVTQDFQIREYTPDGVRVQTINVPHPNPAEPGASLTRDVVVLSNGNVAVFNGAFRPYLSVLNTQNGTWTHTTHDGWSDSGNAGHAGMGAFGSRVFVTDQSTAGSEEAGMIAFDIESGTSVRFDPSRGQGDVNVGLDGKLYSFSRGGSPVDELYVHNPLTLQIDRTITLSEGYTANGIAANRKGEIFLTDGSASIRKLSPTGQVLHSYPTPTFGITDIDISPDGRVIFGTRTEGAFLTDETFGIFDRIPNLPNVRVGFTYAVPEPTSAAMVAMALVLTQCRVSRTRRRTRRLDATRGKDRDGRVPGRIP